MYSICAECHKKGYGCCLLEKQNQKNQIGIFLKDIEIIEKFINISRDYFIIEDKIDLNLKEELIREIHPIFDKLYYKDIRFKLKTINGKCFFLKENGCELPEDIRPLYCRIYPFWPSKNNDFINVLSSDLCFAQAESTLSWKIVNKYFLYSEEYLNFLCKELLDFAELHIDSLNKIKFKTDNPNNFSIRKLNNNDIYRIKEICKDIWDGGDYIPLIATKWINDNDGVFWGAEYNSILYGLSRISYIGKNIAWLEGLRADPNCTVKGIANAFNNFFINKYLVNKSDIKYIEFVTYFKNTPSIKSAEKYGFSLISKSTFKFIEFNETFQLSEKISFKNITSIDDKIRYFYESEFIQTDRFFSGWSGYPSDDECLKNFLSDTFCFEIENNICCLKLDFERKEANILYVIYNNTDLLNILINTCKNQSYKNNIFVLQIVIPSNHKLLKIVDMTEFRSYEENDDYHFYRKLNF